MVENSNMNPETAESPDVDELESLRQEINSIDKSMAALFQARMKTVQQIAAYKREHGLSIFDGARESDVIALNRSYISDPEIEPHYVDFMHTVMNISRRYQEKIISSMKIAYTGVPGAFSYIAAKKMFPSARLIAFPTFTQAYRAVESGEVDSAVLPLENSWAGEVGEVMDLIFSGSLFINQVLDLPVTHDLLGIKGAGIQDITRVTSHPQALEQCRSFLEARNIEATACSNTAAAAKMVSDAGDIHLGAIASSETSKIFGLDILEPHINDDPYNTTRFAAFSRAQNRPQPDSNHEDDHFILVFTAKNEASSLAQVLNIIGAHDYNMGTMRSRPMKGLLWNYYFYIEAEGNIHTEEGTEMLRELNVLCAQLKMAGTFRAGTNLISSTVQSRNTTAQENSEE